MVRLFLAELKREWILQLRYTVEIVSFVVGLVVVFYGLFQSAQYIAGPSVQFGDRLDSIVVGYVLWSLSIFILSDIAGGLQQEAQTGTLEQVFLSPFGALQIFMIRAVANLTIQLILNLSILLIIMAMTGSRLSFPPTLLLPLLTVLLGAYGLALVMGSLALLLKRVQQVLGIFQFLLFFVLLVPIETWASSTRFLGWLLPMTPGAGLLRELMAQGQSLNLAQFLVALVNGAAYFVLGLFLFRLAEREAKQRGKLGGY
jgi:ABC-2 type transport system permease protein